MYILVVSIIIRIIKDFIKFWNRNREIMKPQGGFYDDGNLVKERIGYADY